MSKKTWLIIIVLLVSLGVVGGGYMYLHKSGGYDSEYSVPVDDGHNHTHGVY